MKHMCSHTESLVRDLLEDMMIGGRECKVQVIVPHFHLSSSASPAGQGDVPLVKTTSHGSRVLPLGV